MAEAIPESKSAAKMATDSQQPPPEYIVKETQFGPIETCLPLGTFPVIDLSLLLQSPDELDKLRSSLSSLGCFQIIGHGMSDSFLDRIREVAVEFFRLPDEEKLKSGRAANESEGYGSDVVVSDKQVLDWTQRLILGALPVHRRKLNLWPQNPPQFSEILEEYAMRLKTVKEVLFKAIAKSLNLEENCFLDHLGDQRILTARFNFYPPCPRPDLVHGVKPHTDLSVLSVLLQDREIEGLQVRVNGEWKRVPVIPNALVVNIGDQMQIMTNGIYKSPLHRVVTNTEKLRISIAAFTEVEPEKEIGPVPQLIDEQRPRVYRNVTNYGAINYECYQKGLVALETVRV